VTGYGLDEQEPGVRVPIGENFSLLYVVQVLKPTQPHIEWVSKALSPGVKLQGREDDHSLPSSVEVKYSGAIPPLTHKASQHNV
jgi:hypothetical protein